MRKFPCGHAGKGQYCHRCAQAAELLKRAKDETDAGKLAKLKADADLLLAVPKKASTAPMMPSDPIPS
jgi:hypothetical protein